MATESPSLPLHLARSTSVPQRRVAAAALLSSFHRLAHLNRQTDSSATAAAARLLRELHSHDALLIMRLLLDDRVAPIAEIALHALLAVLPPLPDHPCRCHRPVHLVRTRLPPERAAALRDPDLPVGDHADLLRVSVIDGLLATRLPDRLSHLLVAPSACNQRLVLASLAAICEASSEACCILASRPGFMSRLIELASTLHATTTTTTTITMASCALLVICRLLQTDSALFGLLGDLPLQCLQSTAADLAPPRLAALHLLLVIYSYGVPYKTGAVAARLIDLLPEAQDDEAAAIYAVANAALMHLDHAKHAHHFTPATCLAARWLETTSVNCLSSFAAATTTTNIKKHGIIEKSSSNVFEEGSRFLLLPRMALALRLACRNRDYHVTSPVPLCRDLSTIILYFANQMSVRYSQTNADAEPCSWTLPQVGIMAPYSHVYAKSRADPETDEEHDEMLVDAVECLATLLSVCSIKGDFDLAAKDSKCGSILRKLLAQLFALGSPVVVHVCVPMLGLPWLRAHLGQTIPDAPVVEVDTLLQLTAYTTLTMMPCPMEAKQAQLLAELLEARVAFPTFANVAAESLVPPIRETLFIEFYEPTMLPHTWLVSAAATTSTTTDLRQAALSLLCSTAEWHNEHTPSSSIWITAADLVPLYSAAEQEKPDGVLDAPAAANAQMARLHSIISVAGMSASDAAALDTLVNCFIETSYYSESLQSLLLLSVFAPKTPACHRRTLVAGLASAKALGRLNLQPTRVTLSSAFDAADCVPDDGDANCDLYVAALSCVPRGSFAFCMLSSWIRPNKTKSLTAHVQHAIQSVVLEGRHFRVLGQSDNLASQ